MAATLTHLLDESLKSLTSIDSASAAMITFVLPSDGTTLPPTGTGVLIPLATEWNDDILMTTAVTFLDR